MAITAAQLMVKVGADTSDAERGLQSVSDRLGSFSKQAAMTGGLLTAGVTLPLVGVAKGALDMAIDYEDAMNMVQAVSGATADEMDVIADTAKALGSDLTLPATSAADATTAMLELAKAGLSIEDTLGAAKGVLQLSAAGQLSNAAAAEIAANALNAFGLEGSEATRVADLLAAAANASSAEVTDVADALKMSSAVFASAGIPIEELVASISQMANAGIKGSDAGTSLKQMLLSLQAPSDKAADLMSELGISIYDSQGQMLPFGQIIEQFSSKLGELTQEERNAALATIFGSDAVRAANIVMMGGVDAHQQMIDAVTRQGAAADLAGARMKGLGGALEGLKSQVETVLLDVAEPFLGTLEGWARSLADLVPRITELDPNIRNAALAFGAVLAAAGPVLAIVGALSGALAFLLSPIGLVVAAVAALAAAFAGDFGGIRTTLMPLFDGLRDTLGALLGLLAGAPDASATLQEALGRLGEAARGVGDKILQGLAAIDWAGIGQQALTYLGNALTTAEDLAVRLMGWLSEQFGRIDWNTVLATVGNWTASLIRTAGDLAGQLTSWLGEEFSRIDWNAVWANVTGLADGLQTKLNDAAALGWSALFTPIGDALAPITRPIQDAISTLGTVFAPLIEKLGGSFANLQQHLTPVWANLEKLGASLQRLWDVISPALLPALEILGAVIGGIIAVGLGIVIGLINGFINALGPLLEMITGVANGIVEMITGVIGVFRGLWTIGEGVLLFFTGDWLGGWNKLKEGFGLLTTGIWDIFRGLWDTVTSIFVGAFDTVIGFVSGFIGGIIGWFQSLYNALESIIPDLINGIVGWFQYLWTMAETIFEQITLYLALVWENIKSVAQAAWDGIKGVIEGVWNGIQTTVGSALTILATTLSLAWDGIRSVAETAWNGIWGAIKAVINLIIGGINALVAAWNRLEFKIPGFDVELPSVDVPGIGRVGGGHLGWSGITVGTPDIPLIPTLATGGIVTRPTLALIGEAGPEAVVPLRGGGAAGDVYVTVHVSGSVVAERDLARSIREELLRTSKRNVFAGVV